jgi:hypothetical protein
VITISKNGHLSFKATSYSSSVCWLDTELANTDKERSVVVKGVLLLLFNFKSKLVQSKE